MPTDPQPLNPDARLRVDAPFQNDRFDFPEMRLQRYAPVMIHLMLPEVAHQHRALQQTHRALLSDRLTQKVDE